MHASVLPMDGKDATSLHRKHVLFSSPVALLGACDVGLLRAATVEDDRVRMRPELLLADFRPSSSLEEVPLLLTKEHIDPCGENVLEVVLDDLDELLLDGLHRITTRIKHTSNVGVRSFAFLLRALHLLLFRDQNSEHLPDVWLLLLGSHQVVLRHLDAHLGGLLGGNFSLLGSRLVWQRIAFALRFASFFIAFLPSGLLLRRASLGEVHVRERCRGRAAFLRYPSERL
mmetsp:Transcript_4555/g.17931  ORF Transcript_4555/g.17931 Transcript_4555/m.17931 type:complete len:229 (-) Transcript_4555:954-1640(-)